MEYILVPLTILALFAFLLGVFAVHKGTYKKEITTITDKEWEEIEKGRNFIGSTFYAQILCPTLVVIFIFNQLEIFGKIIFILLTITNLFSHSSLIGKIEEAIHQEKKQWKEFSPGYQAILVIVCFLVNYIILPLSL